MLLWFAYPFNYDSITELISVEWNDIDQVDDSSRTGKACHVTIPADDKPHGTAWAVGLRTSGLQSQVVAACYLNVLLAIQTAWLGFGQDQRCTVSKKQLNMQCCWQDFLHDWVVWVLSCRFENEISQQPYSVCSCSLRLSQFPHFIHHQNELLILLGHVSNRSSSASSVIPN